MSSLICFKLEVESLLKSSSKSSFLIKSLESLVLYFFKFKKYSRSIFFEKVRACYLKRAEDEPDRFRIINSGLPLQKVEDEITAILRKLEC